jgi:hypothetical protein
VPVESGRCAQPGQHRRREQEHEPLAE